jgi:hypothetical protein
VTGRTVHGSTYLTEEQRDWYRAKFGLNYVAVAQNQVVANRKVRRRKRRKDLG